MVTQLTVQISEIIFLGHLWRHTQECVEVLGARERKEVGAIYSMAATGK